MMKPIFSALLASVLLGACSTPQPEHFYTLSGGADAQPAKPVKYYVEVLAVSVPQQVSRNQFVVTAPSGRIELLEQHLEKSFAFSVCSFGFPVQRALTLDGQGALTALYPEFRNTRSQDLPEAFQDAGQFYWGRSDAWLRGEVVYSPASLPVILPRHLVQDIDTLEDWKRAEYLYAALKAGGELS